MINRVIRIVADAVIWGTDTRWQAPKIRWMIGGEGMRNGKLDSKLTSYYTIDSRGREEIASAGVGGRPSFVKESQGLFSSPSPEP